MTAEHESPMGNDHTKRANIRPGMRVLVVLKHDQRSGKRTPGIVRDILTPSATHPRGIKVRLEDGLVGRVQEIVDGPTDESAPARDGQ